MLTVEVITTGAFDMSDYMLDLPIVYAGRSYMVRPGTRRAKYLERAALHYGMRDYDNARELFAEAVSMPHVDAGMVGGPHNG